MIKATFRAPGGAMLRRDDDKRYIEGVGLTLGERVEQFPGYSVMLPRKAFTKKALKDVVLNAFEHGAAALARTPKTMTVELTADAVRYSAAVDELDGGMMDVYRRVEKGVLDGASLGLLADFDYDVSEADGSIEATAKKVHRVHEVTLTERPVFPNTTAAALMRDQRVSVDAEHAFAQIPEEVLARREAVLAKLDESSEPGGQQPPDYKQRGAATRSTVPPLA